MPNNKNTEARRMEMRFIEIQKRAADKDSFTQVFSDFVKSGLPYEETLEAIRLYFIFTDIYNHDDAFEMALNVVLDGKR